MAIYPDHRFWFGYWTGGLVAYDETAQKKIRQFTYASDRKNALPSSAIQCMFKDRDNNIWIGTDNGAAYFNPGAGNIHVVNSNVEGFEKIHLSDITDLLPDNNGNILMSMYEYGDSSNHGIARFNTANNTCKKLISARGNDLSGLIWSMLKDANGNLMLNTQIGLFYYDLKNHSFTRNFPYPISPRASQTRNGLSEFYKDKEGNYWYGLWRKGLVKYDPVTGKEDYFSANNSDSNRRLSGNLIESVAEDSRKQIWVSTNESSILNCITANGSLRHVSLMINGQVLNTILKKIVPDSAGELWIATSNLGLIRYDPTSNQTRIYGTPDGVPNTTIDNLCFDRKGRLWIYSATGLAWMDPQRENINWLHDELPGFRDYFDPQPMIMGDDGKIYLGNSATLYYFDPDEILSDIKLNAPVLLSITASDKTLQLPPETKEIVIQPEEENIRIAFTSINISHSRQINYAYRLKDYDRNWTTTHAGEAVYNKLPPGTYQFEFQSDIQGSKESRKTAVVTIKVLATYYQTWWFRLILGVLLAVALATAIYYSSTRHLRKRLSTLEKQKEINAVRNRIAQDIHDDIGSGLTKISIQSELAKQHKSLSGSDYEDILSKIHKQSNELVTNLGEIVWTINPEYDKAESLEAYFRYYIHQYMDGTAVRSRFHFSGSSHDIVVNPDIKRNLFLMLKEALNNIVKHANASEAVIDFIVKNNQYRMTIKDNGTGMDLTKNKRFGNGIANLEKRAKQIQADIQISSQKEKGTEIVVNGRFY
jgi:signal transduction histidine kinase/streptogramin lyase